MPLVASVMPCANQTSSCELCTYQLLSWHAVPPGSLALPGAQRWSHCAPTACAGTLSVHGQSPTKKQHSHVTLCVPPWFVDLIPYSGKLLREKTFANFAVCGYSWKFSLWNLGRGILWRGTSKQSVEAFPMKIVFFTNSRKFSLSKVSRYKIHELVCAHVCTHVRACVHVTPCDQHSMWFINPPHKLL